MKYSVIKITAGSVELAVGDSNGKVLHKERKPISLVSYVENKRLSERGVEKLTEIINKFKEICIERGADEIHSIALELKKLLSAEVLDSIYMATGLKFKKLSGKACAYYDSISAEEFFGRENLVVINTGGCVTTLSDMGNIFSRVVKMGSVKICSDFIKNVFPSKKETQNALDCIEKKLKSGFFNRYFSDAVIIGDVSYAVAQMYADYFHEKLDKEFVMTRKKLNEFFKFFLGDSQRSALVLKYAPERLFTAAGSVLILKAILKKLKPARIYVRDYSVIDGYLRAAVSGKLYQKLRDANIEHAETEEVLTVAVPKEKAAPKAAPAKKSVAAKPKVTAAKKPAPKTSAVKAATSNKTSAVKKPAAKTTQKPTKKETE